MGSFNLNIQLPVWSWCITVLLFLGGIAMLSAGSVCLVGLRNGDPTEACKVIGPSDGASIALIVVGVVLASPLPLLAVLFCCACCCTCCLGCCAFVDE